MLTVILVILLFLILLIVADLISTKKEVIKIRKTLEELTAVLKDSSNTKK